MKVETSYSLFILSSNLAKKPDIREVKVLRPQFIYFFDINKQHSTLSIIKTGSKKMLFMITWDEMAKKEPWKNEDNCFFRILPLFYEEAENHLVREKYYQNIISLIPLTRDNKSSVLNYISYIAIF